MKVIYDQGGIYLDTDVELKNGLDELLQYDAWFAQDDIRWINTGLGFGACRGNELLKRIIVQREKREFDMTVCTSIDTPIIREYLGLKQSRDSQYSMNILIVGMMDYGHYARHHANLSWKEPEQYSLEKQREGRNWKLKCFLRNPDLINFLEKNGENHLSKAYVFFAYDFLDNGLIYFVKRLVNKIAGKEQ